MFETFVMIAVLLVVGAAAGVIWERVYGSKALALAREIESKAWAKALSAKIALRKDIANMEFQGKAELAAILQHIHDTL